MVGPLICGACHEAELSALRAQLAAQAEQLRLLESLQAEEIAEHVRLETEALRAQLAEALDALRDLQQDGITGETQNRIREHVIRLSGCSEIDGTGSDGGPVEFTLAEIGQGFAVILDQLAGAQSALWAAREALEWSLRHLSMAYNRMHGTVYLPGSGEIAGMEARWKSAEAVLALPALQQLTTNKEAS